VGGGGYVATEEEILTVPDFLGSVSGLVASFGGAAGVVGFRGGVSARSAGGHRVSGVAAMERSQEDKDLEVLAALGLL
jgi:hypothetical protein